MSTAPPPEGLLAKDDVPESQRGGPKKAAPREEIDAQTLVTKVAAFVRQNPTVPVLIGGDHRVDYGRIYDTMVLLQQAGAPRVGLMSQPTETTPPKR